MRKTTFTVVLFWTLGTAMAAWAQVDTATVTGTVRDTSGAVVTNTTVIATETETGIKVSTKSNPDGGLAYAALYPAPNQPGTANNYSVNAPGYCSRSRDLATTRPLAS